MNQRPQSVPFSHVKKPGIKVELPEYLEYLVPTKEGFLIVPTEPVMLKTLLYVLTRMVQKNSR